MRFRICVLIFLLFPWFALGAETPPTVEKIPSGDSFTLSDGRTVRLLGITVPSNETPELAAKARDALQALAFQKSVDIREPSLDRYGRTTGQIYLLGGKDKPLWLQEEMLRSGMALVYPPTGSEPRLAEMLKTEKAARQAHKGLWADKTFADMPATDAMKHVGRFVFVIGTVIEVKNIKNKIWLHFGANWRKDFSVMIPARNHADFLKAETAPETYQGKTIRVRGWMKREPGPMITVTTPAQIEIIPSVREKAGQ